MEILLRTNPHHLKLTDGTRLSHLPDIADNLQYHYGLEMPHFLNYKQGIATAILPSDLLLEEGDMVKNEYSFKAMVIEVIERRPARGDWSKNPYDQKPDWVKMRLM